MKSSAEPSISRKPSPLDKELVKEFVIKGHADLAGTKALLEKEPGLLNACWDWGGGDFETALEGAGHMGNKEIANFLLSKSARMNILCAAMLGRFEVVKSILTAYPNLKTSKGPHGLQLLHHATKGGADALPVLEYLKYRRSIVRRTLCDMIGRVRSPRSTRSPDLHRWVLL